jgi:prepilin-type N-terminal cleavage/methylation domain-containing protein
MARGYSLLELLLVLALITILAGTAIPLALSSLDQSRTAAAATYVSGKLMEARLEAVKRSASVGFSFCGKTTATGFRPTLMEMGTACWPATSPLVSIALSARPNNSSSVLPE